MAYVEGAETGGKGEILERERGARGGREEGATFSLTPCSLLSGCVDACSFVALATPHLPPS